jgi:hypothetical protein
MEEPPELALNRMRREIYATIAIDVGALCSAAVRAALCEAYLALPADGYWVKLAGFDERAARADIRAGGAFLADLRDGGRPVLCDQPGQLHLALLADGLSTAIGIAEGERFRFPTNWPGADADQPRPGRRRSAYHAKLLRAYLVGGEAAARAFAEAACPCGHHSQHQPPDGQTVEAHAAAVRCAQAREALNGELEDRREWLLATAAMATHIAHDAAWTTSSLSSSKSCSLAWTDSTTAVAMRADVYVGRTAKRDEQPPLQHRPPFHQRRRLPARRLLGVGAGRRQKKEFF